MRSRVLPELMANTLAVLLVGALLFAAHPAEALSPFSMSGGFTILQEGIPDERVINDPDYSSLDDSQSWEAYDIEPYGAGAIADIVVLGSSFINVGSIDIGATPEGVVFGQIYLEEGDWVAHLEGLLTPAGIEGYVLAANGEIAHIYLAAPGLSAILMDAVHRAWATPTPTPDPEGSPTPEESYTPTPTSETPSPTPTPTATHTPLPAASATPTPPDDCEYFSFATSDEYFGLSQGNDAESVVPLWCSSNYPMLPVVNVTDEVTGVVVRSTALLRFDTSLTQRPRTSGFGPRASGAGRDVGLGRAWHL